MTPRLIQYYFINTLLFLAIGCLIYQAFALAIDIFRRPKEFWFRTMLSLLVLATLTALIGITIVWKDKNSPPPITTTQE